MDRLGRRLLPRGNITYHCDPDLLDFLIKFSIFRNPEDDVNWVLPSDLTSRKVAGTYRVLSRQAILELGDGIQNQKAFLSLVPDGFETKKRPVWRQGMAEHILMTLRKNALDRLYTVPGEYVFRANVNNDLTAAEIGERAPPLKDFHGTSGRRRFANQFPKWKFKRRLESMTSLNEDVSSTTDKTAPLRQETQGSEASLSENELSVLGEIGTETISPTISEPLMPPFISAVLYLGPRHLRHEWGFKLVTVLNRSLPVVLINMQRLFADEAEVHFFKRQIDGNAIAIAASQICRNALWHVLRLSFYIQGDKEVNVEDKVMTGPIEKEAGGRPSEREEKTAPERDKRPKIKQKMVA